MIQVPKEYKRFVNSVKRKCKYHGINLVLSPSKNVIFTDDFKNECSGYFSEGEKLLVVACGKPAEEWMETLVHESCHMDQWIQNDPRAEEWEKACYDFGLFIQGGRNFSETRISAMIDSLIDLELDCEMRSVEKIYKWNLPLNINNYIKLANAYISSYRMVGTYRRFPTCIGNDLKLVAAAPNKFMDSYDVIPKPLAKELHRFYKELLEADKKAA